MTARTDRIAKLETRIARGKAGGEHPEATAVFERRLATFSGMQDFEYDDLIAMNEKTLETGRFPSGMPLKEG